MVINFGKRLLIMLDEYELRQLLLFKQIISQYKNNEINLNSLISRIEELLDLFEEIDSAWHEKVKCLWFDIEIINAMKLIDQEKFTQEDLQAPSS
ncbi:MAG: hypothetical protein RCO49_05700 [Rickettsia endosymbiont of Argas persicus]